MLSTTTDTRKTLEEYLALEYPFNVIADPDGGYVVEFPDLPGCVTQAETLDEVVPMARDAFEIWMESAWGQEDLEIPPPSYPEEYSGRFNLRLPRSLHRKLAEAAERDGVSLNTYVGEVLARGDAQAQIERRLRDLEKRLLERLDAIDERVDEIHESMRYRPAHVPGPSLRRR
jgi:predicted RNase H-like HicB family nuclease